MGVDKGAVVLHSPHQYFRLVRHAAPKKSDDLKYENVIKKETKFVPINTIECTKSHHFQNVSLDESKVKFDCRKLYPPHHHHKKKNDPYSPFLGKFFVFVLQVFLHVENIGK